MTQCTDETAGDLTPTLTLRWYYLVEGLVRRYYMEHSGKYDLNCVLGNIHIILHRRILGLLGW